MSVPLTQLLESASIGDRSAARSFFETFLRSKLFVPDRQQAHPLTDAPSYPTPLVHVLGVRDGDRVFVPFFTELHLIQSWSGAPLRYRELSGQQLLDAIPEGWWGILNPGQEVQKEFSPWELSTMRGIPGTIDELLEELYLEEGAEPITIRPIDEARYEQVVTAVRTLCERERGVVQTAHFVMELSATQETQRLILNLSTTGTPAEREEVRQRFRSALAPLLIGAEPLQILVGTGGEEILAGLVQGTPPIWRGR